MNINLFCCVVCILLFQCVNGYGQLSIKGSTCVIANREYQYILNGNWNDICIDIIDSVDMEEDLTHLLNHPLNTITNSKYNFRKYT